MLYVFHVDTGRMIKFDMNVALTSVQNLKDIIEKRHGVPADKVVLLVSGGEMLTPNSLVCSYSAGTDTNPIYMFTTVDVKPHPWPSIEPGHFSDTDLAEQVERCLSLPSSHTTIAASAQLGQQFYTLGHEEETICETLVHEQHLQQQGWSAVIANMEDLTDEFRQRFETFSRCFEDHLSKRREHLELLQNFNQDLINLSKIPILPGLLQNAEEEFHGFDKFLDNDEVFSQSQGNATMGHQSTNSQCNIDDSKITTVASDNNVNCDPIDKSGDGDSNSSNIRNMITSSSGSSSVVEQKRPRLSKENTPETVVTNSGSNADKCVDVSNNKAVITGRNLTLLQWISAKENNDALRVMAEECSQGLASFTKEKYVQLKNEVDHIIKYARQEEIKEIKGLEDRLGGLEKLMFNLRKIVQEQDGHAKALQMSQNRTRSLGDPSIIPDICESHRSQLKVMLNNHKQIRDYRKRISKSKDELGMNLNKRLKFIVQIENAMSDKDHLLLFYHRCQRRVERHLNIIQQIHQTPKIYLAAVTEVVRRRIFSGEFVQWASSLACDFDAIHNEEIERRRQFNTNFEGHFLNILFPGMNDMPPAFANESPIIFDASLPNITKNDIDMLTSFLPDISDSIHLPDMKAVIEFFSSRSGNKNSVQKMSTTQATSTNEEGGTPGIVLHRPIDLHAHLKDGFESETDTEEFEKVGERSASEVQNLRTIKASLLQQNNSKQLVIQQNTVATSTSENQLQMKSAYIETEPILMLSVETITEETAECRQKEILKLKSLLQCMSQVSFQCIKMLKEDLYSIKTDQLERNNELHEQLRTLSQTWNLVQEQYEIQNQEYTAELKSTHELELKNLQDNVHQYEVELERLKSKQLEIESSNMQRIESIEKESMQLRQTLAVRKEEIEQFQEKLNLAEQDKQKALSELRDRLIHEHKTELESLRCRFKIMTSMERSPSDSSLEKIEKSDMIDISCHESILLQTREDLNIEKEAAVQKAREEFQLEKQKAIQEAIAFERIKWEQANTSPTSIMAMTANMELLKKMVEEKDKQLDMMREREIMYNKEICQLKMKIESLTNEEESDKGWMKEKIDFLTRNNHKLEQELNLEKDKLRRMEMESSVATMRNSNIDQSMVRSKLSSSQTSSTTSGGSGASGNIPRLPTISTDSCQPGDLVFIVWNIKHGQFIIIQESPNLYFVHADSLPSLNLKLPLPGDIEVPVPFYTIAKVVHKEFCQARKDENRYKVSKGTKFFRVKLQPTTEMKWHLRRERLEFATLTSGTMVNRSTSTQHLIDSCCQTESGIVAAISSAMEQIVPISNSNTILTVTTISQCGLSLPSSPLPISTICDSTSGCRVIGGGSSFSSAVSGSVSGDGGGSGAVGGITGSGSGKDICSFNIRGDSEGDSGNASTSQDMVDSVSLKERTVSVTSFTTEDTEEPISMLSDRCRYSGVSEEDTQPVTEQPTSSNNDNGTSEINQSRTDTYHQLTANISSSDIDMRIKLTTSSDDLKTTIQSAMLTSSTSLSIQHQQQIESSGSSIPIKIKTEEDSSLNLLDYSSCNPQEIISSIIIGDKEQLTTDDSDEYRSLEAKDDFLDFSVATETNDNIISVPTVTVTELIITNDNDQSASLIKQSQEQQIQQSSTISTIDNSQITTTTANISSSSLLSSSNPDTSSMTLNEDNI